MTREEIIAQLRGVHFPPAPAESGDIVLAQWPLWTFAAITFVVVLIRWWRQNAWRREARAMLKHIETLTDPKARWHALLDLSIRIAHLRGQKDPLPAFAYRAPETVSDRDAHALVRHIRNGLGR